MFIPDLPTGLGSLAEEIPMCLLRGILLGVLLTVGGAFIYDRFRLNSSVKPRTGALAGELGRGG